MIAMFGATLVHLTFWFFFVVYLDLGIRGLAYASSVKDFVLILSVMIYGNCSEKIRPALSMPDSESFRGWGEYLKVALPSTVMICAEWWAFLLLSVISGTMGVPELAAQTLYTNLASLLYQAPLGI